MNNQPLTHWKRLKNPDYFGAYAMPSDGSEIVLTIKSAGQERVSGSDGKKTDCLVIHFMENVKPMILNTTNAKAISKVAKSNYIEQWSGVQIQIYVDRVRAFGDDLEVLRVRQTAPKNLAPVQSQISQDDVDNACIKLEGSETLEELKENYASLSKQLQAHPEVIATKDNLKSQLA